jgi:hypothetical protein
LPVAGEHLDKVYKDLTQDGKFFQDLQDKDKKAANNTRRQQMRMAKWRALTDADRQAFIKLQQEKREAKSLEATRPQREAEEQRIKNNKEWKECKKVIESIYIKQKRFWAKIGKRWSIS